MKDRLRIDGFIQWRKACRTDYSVQFKAGSMFHDADPYQTSVWIIFTEEQQWDQTYSFHHYRTISIETYTLSR